jgi:hypothetical protein
MLVNPYTRAVLVVLTTGETVILRPMSLARVEGDVVTAEYVLATVEEPPGTADAA